MQSILNIFKDGDSAACPVQLEFHAVHFLPVASYPVSEHNWGEPGYVVNLLCPHQQAFRNIAEITQTQAFSSPGWSLSSLSLFSCERFFSSLIIFVEVNKMLHLIRGIRSQRRKCFSEEGKKTTKHKLITVKRTRRSQNETLRSWLTPALRFCNLHLPPCVSIVWSNLHDHTECLIYW